jgi:hypothetical protein
MSESTQTPTAEITHRWEKHEVEIRLRVSGYPDIDDQEVIKTRCQQFRPSSVAIQYQRGLSGWVATARVYGQPPGGSLLNHWAEYSQHGPSWCPAWLMELMTEHEPAYGGGEQ